MERRSPRRSWRRPLIWLASACALITLAAACLAFMAFRTPLETVRTDVGTVVSQLGQHAWSASLYPNHLYDSNSVSGETTIFTNITRALNMEFSYQISARGAEEIHGTYAVDLTIGSGQNWSKRVPLVSPRAFATKGDTASVWAPYALDIAWLKDTIGEIEDELGVSGGPCTLTISPTVTATATGSQISDQAFAAPVELVLSEDRRQITMPLQREFSTETSLPVVTRVPGVVPVFSLTLPVAETRVWATAAGGAALLLAVWLAVLARLPKGEQVIDERRVRRANMHLFIEAKSDVPSAFPTIEVRDLKQLVKVARGTGKPVVHAGNGVHYVVDSGVVYLCGDVARTNTGVSAGVSGGPHPALVPRRQRREAVAEA